MIFVNGKLYTFSDHMLLAYVDHGVKAEWIDEVMNNPERYELSNSSGYHLYIGRIENRPESFYVVVDEESLEIITAFFQKSMP